MPSPKEGMDISHFIRVGAFKDLSSNEWNHWLVKETFCEESAAEILEIPWPPITCEDILIWIGNNLGHFSVNECCNFNFYRESSNLIMES